jgi:hypothetical protein
MLCKEGFKKVETETDFQILLWWGAENLERR